MFLLSPRRLLCFRASPKMAVNGELVNTTNVAMGDGQGPPTPTLPALGKAGADLSKPPNMEQSFFEAPTAIPFLRSSLSACPLHGEAPPPVTPHRRLRSHSRATEVGRPAGTSLGHCNETAKHEVSSQVFRVSGVNLEAPLPREEICNWDARHKKSIWLCAHYV